MLVVLVVDILVLLTYLVVYWSLRIFCTEEYFNNDGGEGDEEDCGAEEESEWEGRLHPASQTNTALTLTNICPAGGNY